MVEIIGLAKERNKGINFLTATFKVNGELTPLKINEKDNYSDYHKALSMLADNELGTVEGVKELFNLMSPLDRVTGEIKSSKKLRSNLSVVDGQIYFGKFRLEETLASHILSLLGDDDVPKDEKLWGSYVKFLDNLHQNMDEDVRTQLYKWLAYENADLGGFGITEDGCLIGYRGCNGTVLEPVSVHAGPATVDGVDMNGHIPNKVGSVITMPRTAVQVDPTIGCSTGLHVGTKAYATSWAPILLVVKVNPRDVVSVPYECDSQKMRVCEYTVLEVLDTGGEQNHRLFHPNTSQTEIDESDFPFNDNLEDFVDTFVEVEYDNGNKYFKGIVGDIYAGRNPGLIIRTEDGEYKHIKTHRITSIISYDLDLEWHEGDADVYQFSDNDKDTEDNNTYGNLLAKDLADFLGEVVLVNYDNYSEEFEGTVVDIWESTYNPGIIIKSELGEYKHIKLHRISEIETLAKELEPEDEVESKVENEPKGIPSVVQAARNVKLGDFVVVYYDKDKIFSGDVVNIYKDYEGLIIKGNNEVKHIKVDRLSEILILF